MYTIRYKDPFRSTYEADHDTFKYVQYAIAPAAALGLVFNEGHWAKQSLAHYAFEICWAFSIWLEAIAIVPQLILLQRHRSVENITSWCVGGGGGQGGRGGSAAAVGQPWCWKRTVALAHRPLATASAAPVPAPTPPTRCRYVFSLGAYRAMYIVNWVYRFLTEPHYR